MSPFSPCTPFSPAGPTISLPSGSFPGSPRWVKQLNEFEAPLLTTMYFSLEILSYFVSLEIAAKFMKTPSNRQLVNAPSLSCRFFFFLFTFTKYCGSRMCKSVVTSYLETFQHPLNNAMEHWSVSQIELKNTNLSSFSQNDFKKRQRNMCFCISKSGFMI